MQAIGGLREGLWRGIDEAAERPRVGHGRIALHLLMVARREFSGRHVANRLEQSPGVEPIDPPERREFDRLELAPRTFSLNHRGLKQPNDGFGERVIRVAAAADRRRDAGLR
jgi:hypothetical protein